MEASFWHNLWDKKETGWHMENTNDFLVRHFSKLNLEANSRVFIPLCGKTVDIKWLLDRGHRVVGIELNETAIKELFEYLNLEATKTEVGSMFLYRADNIDIYVGDIFELNQRLLGHVDAVYDRGAIVALPSGMRKEYTERIMDITANASQLIISFDYDQTLRSGPPFSVDQSLLSEYYSDKYEIKLLETLRIKEFGIDLDENVWILEQHPNA
ncbi:MAG TPA: thiopurine S-methyltransferase [Campylobacterales bacterium]|nr:thiopurine S-methyltransferase [Campylobacterales bacterium]